MIDLSGSPLAFNDLRTRRRVPSVSGIAQRLERYLNQVGALVLLLLAAPLMALVTWSIWRRDGAPILFAHYRVGRNGELFQCLKFRSMYLDSERMLQELLLSDPLARAEWERDQKLSRDPRITPVGHLLRKTSLDELPQLINVLRGEMSLVGPRPITTGELARYGAARWHYLSVTPGMTGLWQVSGRNNTTYDERVALDRRYVEERSVGLDLSILWRTLGVVIARDGAK